MVLSREGAWSDQWVSTKAMIAGGLAVKEGSVRVWRAPEVKCRRSPLLFQNTMVGIRGWLLAIQREGAKDRVEPGCGGRWCGKTMLGKAGHELIQGR